MSGSASPDFLTTEFTFHNGTTEESALIAVAGMDRTFVMWRFMDDQTQQILFDLIMAYADKNGATEATALPVPVTSGWHTVNFGGTILGANPTGLNPARTYTATIIVDGTGIPISILGSAAATFNDLINEINTDLGAAAMAAIVNGDIEITSSGVGSASSVVVDELDLFKRLNGFTNTGRFYLGVDDTEDVLILNNYGRSPYTLLLDTAYVTFGPKPDEIPDAPFSKDLVYFDHSSSTWKHMYNDTPA